MSGQWVLNENLHKQALALITAERMRQVRLVNQGLVYTRVDGELATDPEKYLVLAEELGEVATAISDATGELLRELVQVAAVATAWIESILRENQGDESMID